MCMEEHLWASSCSGAAGPEVLQLGRTRIESRLVDSLSETSYLVCVDTCVNMCVCIFHQQPFILFSQREKQEEAVPVCVSAYSVSVELAMCLHICLSSTCVLWASVRHRHSASLLMEPGNLECSSLAFVWLLHLTAPNMFVTNSVNAKKQ